MCGTGFVKPSSERSGYPWVLWCPCWPRYSRAKAPLGPHPAPQFHPFFWTAWISPELRMEAASAREPLALCDPDHGLLAFRGSSQSARAAHLMRVCICKFFCRKKTLLW